MRNGEALGPDEIPAEVSKSLGEEGVNLVRELMKVSKVKNGRCVEGV